MAYDNNLLNKLSLDELYEVVPYINQIEDVINLTLVSKYFSNVVKICTKIISSTTIVKIPLELLVKYENIRCLKNIFIEIDQNNIHHLKKICNIIEATFYFKLDHVLTFKQRIIDILKNITKSGAKIKIIGQYTDNRLISLVVDTNKCLCIGHKSDSIINYLKSNMSYYNFILPVLYHPENTGRLGANFLLKKTFIKFVTECNFGLTIPDLPPSDTNPPLSNYLIEIVKTGISNLIIVNKILLIYVYYHQLRSDGIIKADSNIKKYFNQHVPEYNKMPIGRSISLDACKSLDLKTLASLSRLVTSQQVSDINEFDIPIHILTNEETNKIYNIIIQTLQIYRNINSYYTTEGMIKLINFR